MKIRDDLWKVGFNVKHYQDLKVWELYLKKRKRLNKEMLIIVDSSRALEIIDYINDKPMYKSIIVFTDNYA
tara:strand:+ start:262 stop:474 length:213 start_codon:yes stop_codon:yes gene_type:complete